MEKDLNFKMLEKIEFAAGNENKFYEFVDNINKDDKIALISHTDLDGVASAKIINEIFNTEIIKFIDYQELNQNLVNELKGFKVNKVVFTDLSFSNTIILKEIEKFADILIIDHHLYEENLNSNKTIFINAQGVCATYVNYYLSYEIKNIERFDWLVACASIADWMFSKNQEFLKIIFKKYNDEFDINYVKKGKFWDLQYKLSLVLVYFRNDLKKAYNFIGEEFGEVENLNKYAKEVQEEINLCIKKFEQEKIEISDGYFWEFKSKFSIKSIISNILCSKYPEKTLVIGEPGNEYYRLSARRQDKKLDVSFLLRELTKDLDSNAGGHLIAAGATILLKDVNKFKQRLMEYENN